MPDIEQATPPAAAVATVDPTTAALLHEAARLLAADDPDRAADRNNVGFSQADGPLGHSLAATSPQLWPPETVAAGYDTLRKYRVQLLNRGFDFDEIAPPAALSDQARRDARWRSRFRIITHNNRFEVYFPYDESLNSAVRQAGGSFSRDGKDGKCYIVPVQHASQLLEFGDRHRFMFNRTELLAEVTRQLAGRPSANGDSRNLTSVGKPKIRAWIGDSPFIPLEHTGPAPQMLAVKFPFRDDEKRVVLQQATEYLIRWSPLDKSWWVALPPPETAKSWLIRLRSWNTDIHPDLIAWLEQTWKAHEARDAEAAELVRLSAAVHSDLKVVGLDGLMSHQAVAVEYAEKSGWRVFVGDPMGLGKTLEAMAILWHRQQTRGDVWPALVISPANAKYNWADELTEWLGDHGVSHHVLDGRKAYPPPAVDVYICNFDILGAVEGRGIKADPFKPKPGTWTHMFSRPGCIPRSLVVDESHFIMHRRSGRTRAVLTISRAMLADRPESTILMMTGTSAPNGRAEELITQLDALGRLEDLGGAKQVRRTLNGSTADVINFNRRLRATCFLRRRKRGPGGIFPDLEDPDRQQLLVPLDEQIMVQYRQAEQDLIEYLAARARQHALAAGKDEQEAEAAGWEAAMKAESAQHLVAINVLRQLVARAKLPAAFRWVDDYLGYTNRKLIVFAHHQDIVKPLAARYNALVIDGDITSSRRQEIVRQFQTDPSERIIVCSIMAAAVALTLTAASDVLTVEQVWRPGDHSQAEGRAWGRVNDLHTIASTYLVGDGTIDLWMRQLLGLKQTMIQAIEDGLAPPEAEDQIHASVLGSIVVGLTHKGLGDSDGIAGELAATERLAAEVERYREEAIKLETSILADKDGAA